MSPIERLRKSNTIENLWIYILLLLKQREIYAWEIPPLIKREFNFKSGRITPYRVLYRLENQNFVKSTIKERRRVYKITEKGKKELETAKELYKEILKKID